MNVQILKTSIYIGEGGGVANEQNEDVEQSW